MLPEAHVASESPGRTRLRFPSRRRDVAYFEELEESLALCRDVEEVTANPATGSLLVLHRGPPERVARYAEDKGLFLVVARDRRAPSARLASHLSRTARSVDDTIRDSTRNEIDGRSLAFGGFVAAALLQAATGQLLPAATALVVYALQVLPRDDG